MDGVVLAGGRSVRMRVDKARLPTPEGLAWAVHAARTLASVCSRVGIVRREGMTAAPWYEPPGLVLEDVWEPADSPRHALSGLATACEWSQTPMVLVVPVDLVHLRVQDVQGLLAAVPHLRSEAETCLLDSAAGCVVSEQPLFGLFPRAIGHLARAAAHGGHSVRRFVADATVVELPGADLRNANTWSDTGWPHPLDRLRGMGVDDRAVEAERARLHARGLTLPPELG